MTETVQETNIDSLFKEHSFGEIELLRDNLAGEIEKKTELLKSIVKEKYRDIVETSDAIKSMQIELKQVNQSLLRLDKNITDFISKAKEIQKKTSEPFKWVDSNQEEVLTDVERLCRHLVDKVSLMWASFDSNDLQETVVHLNELTRLVETNESIYLDEKPNRWFNDIAISISRARHIIKNHLRSRIRSVAPDQVGVIGGPEQKDLYNLSLECSIETLADNLLKGISEISYQAQIRRYQPPAYYNNMTNQIENVEVDSSKMITSNELVSIPKDISPELSEYLFRVCEVINKIAGFNLDRPSILGSLELTLTKVLSVYNNIIQFIDDLEGEAKRKRAIQLYYDILYLRTLLNSSKSVDLVERFDPEITILSQKYELMLDSIELYMISSALHSNSIALSQSTIRLYGLLIPHLQ